MRTMEEALRKQFRDRKRARELEKREKENSLKRAKAFAAAIAKKYPQTNFTLHKSDLIKKRINTTHNEFAGYEMCSNAVEFDLYPTHVEPHVISQIEASTVEWQDTATAGYYSARF